MKIKWGKLGGALGVTFLAAGIGSLATGTNVQTWYPSLVKPSFSPPNWIFGPVWTVLYVLMAISFYLIWIRKADKEQGDRVKLYVGQLALNSLWSITFFGLRSPVTALITIGFLWMTIVVLMWMFGRVSRTAMFLLLPYLLWVSFAAVLNLMIVVLN